MSNKHPYKSLLWLSLRKPCKMIRMDCTILTFLVKYKKPLHHIQVGINLGLKCPNGAYMPRVSLTKYLYHEELKETTGKA